MVGLDGFGEAVAKARKEYGGSQVELARSVGISRTHLSNIERGMATNVGYETVRRLCTVLGLAMESWRRVGVEPKIDEAGMFSGEVVKLLKTWVECETVWLLSGPVRMYTTDRRKRGVNVYDRIVVAVDEAGVVWLWMREEDGQEQAVGYMGAWRAEVV